VYPNLVATAVGRVHGTGVRVASVATAFPSGQSPLDVKLDDAARAVELGADEVDMVIDRGAFLSGRYAKVYDEIVRVKEVVGNAHLKVILETGELGTYDNVRRASLLAIAAGADFVKTSTGKVAPGASPEAARAMLEAIRDHGSGGFKASGGVRTREDAEAYLALADEILGPDWATPQTFRIGASSLLDELLK
jgi:deoxyribose-phosphate aldolase